MLEAPPPSPSSVSPMSALTNAVVPASTFSRSSAAEAAKTALRDDHGGGFSGDEVRVARERGAARAHGPKQDLVLLERRRLEHDPDAVGQTPLGDAQRVVGRGGGDGSRRREAREQRLRAGRIDVGRQRRAAGSRDDRGQPRLGGQRRPVLLRRGDCDQPVAIGHPVLGHGVDFGQRDLRQEALIQAVLVHDARDRFRLDEVAHELVGQRTRGALVLLDDRPLEPSLEIQLLAAQLRRGEAEAGDAVDLGEERRQASLDVARRDEGVQRGHFCGAHEESAAGLRPEKRRIRRLRDLVEPVGQHGAEQPLDHVLPVGAESTTCGRAAILLDTLMRVVVASGSVIAE